MKIYKHKLSEGNKIKHVREFLSVQMQGKEITIWYVYDGDYDRELDISIYPTGYETNNYDLLTRTTHSKFLGTVQDGHFVWHAFGRFT